jgi:nucleoside-diphosphate-sugar epimerase
MKKILLIGGAGYVGSVITSHFLKLGFEVTVLDNFIYNNQNSILPFIGDPMYKFIKGDFSNKYDLQAASDGVENVVILGGLVGDPITKKYPKESHEINDIGIKACLDFFDNQKNLNKLIFISTCSNYGLIKEDELADENFKLNPLSLYAKAKVSAEEHLMSKKGSANYSAVVLRFATAFGLSPRMRFDLSISEFVRDLYFEKELVVFDEDTWRPYCHVRDFARLIELVINAEKSKVHFEVFNAGGEQNNYTKKMIVETIKLFIPSAKISYGTNGSDPRNYKVSFAKVKNTLGFEPKYDIESGIKELVDSLKIGLFKDSFTQINSYGNFELNY